MSAYNARAINAPQLHCIAVDAAGDVTLTWTLPANLNGSFVDYRIDTSQTQGSGYGVAATITTSTQTTITINGVHANHHVVYFYMITDTTASSTPSDTLASIHLQVNHGFGTAQLLYNALHTPNLSSSSGWYKIYREYPAGVWTEVDSTQSLIAIDTITICSALLGYKVEEEDASGCVSISSMDSSTFTSQIAPPVPVMDTTSVTSTNGVTMSWNRNQKNTTVGYVVYERINGSWKAIDTIHGINNTTYSDSHANPDSASIPFCVAAIDSCGHPSLLSDQQNTMYLTEAPDSCLNANLLTWTGFVDMVPGVKKYNVYMSFNGSPYTILGSTNSSTTSFLQTGVTAVGTYAYFIQAVDSLHPGVTASSNVINYRVAIKHTPRFSYLQTATVVGASANHVECYVDSTAHCSIYELQRSNNIDGPYDSVTTINSVRQHIFFTDPTANPNNQSYYYIVITKNQCGINIDTSQIGQTIYLTALGDDNGVNTLTWNGYGEWTGGVAYYRIFRDEDSSGNYTQIATIYGGSAMNTYQDDVSNIITGRGIFGYYIIATEAPGSYPFIDTSASNTAEAFQDPRLYIPNAFVPNGKNKIFVPVSVFMNVTGYDLTIFNRLGQQVFETTDPSQGWDGSYAGHIAPEAVYIYHLVYTSSKGEYFERNGSITLLK
jgi:gliding motility-associated-like protein